MSEQEQPNLIDKYLGLELRQRAMVLALIAVVMLVIFDLIWYQSVLNEKDKLKRELSVVQTERDDLLEQGKQYQQQLSGAAFGQKRQQLKGLQQQAKQIDASLAQYAQLVSPREMPQILRDFFKQSSKLTLLELTKHEVKPAFTQVARSTQNTDAASTSPPAQANFYRHDFSVRLRGGYFDLLTSLKKLEAMKIKIYWDGLNYRVNQYPQADVVVTVYTYSYARNWIGV